MIRTLTLLALLAPALACGNWALDFDEDFSAASVRRDPYLVAWYKLDGNALDSSGNGYHAQPNEAIGYTNGVIGQAVVTTTTAYLYSTNRAAFWLSSGYSVMAWVRVREQENRWLISQWGAGGSGNASWVFGTDGNGFLRTCHHNGLQTSLFTSGAKPPIGEYMHIAAVYAGGTTGTNAAIYTNGVSAVAGTLNIVPQQSINYDFRIGHTYGIAPGSAANSDLDDVRVYNRALSSNDVARIYQGLKPLHD